MHGSAEVDGVEDFDAIPLALLATARKRGTEKYLADAPAVFDEVENSVVMDKLWTAYRKKFSYAAELSWHTVMDSVRKLYALCQMN